MVVWVSADGGGVYVLGEGREGCMLTVKHPTSCMSECSSVVGCVWMSLCVCVCAYQLYPRRTVCEEAVVPSQPGDTTAGNNKVSVCVRGWGREGGGGGVDECVYW